ncbi:hypothetical protein ACGCUP_09405 [Eubacteriales bacterium KG125]
MELNDLFGLSAYYYKILPMFDKARMAVALLIIPFLNIKYIESTNNSKFEIIIFFTILWLTWKIILPSYRVNYKRNKFWIVQTMAFHPVNKKIFS